MDQMKSEGKTLEEYRAKEVEFHREIMSICRKYLNEIDFAALIGIIDIVKRETIDLENARRRNIEMEKPFEENIEKL